MDGNANETHHPAPTPVPFTSAAGEERDAGEASIPEAQSHSGSYAVVEGEANTHMPDAPSLQGPSAAGTQLGIQNQWHPSSHDSSVVPESQNKSYPAPAIHGLEPSLQPSTALPTSSVPTARGPSFSSSQNSTAINPQAPTLPIPATSKPSSSITPEASQQQAPPSSNSTEHATQVDQENIVPVGRALEVDVGCQLIPRLSMNKLITTTT